MQHLPYFICYIHNRLAFIGVNINCVQNFSFADQESDRTWFRKMPFQQHGVSRQLQLIPAFFTVGRKLELSGVNRFIGFNCHISNTVKSKFMILHLQIMIGFPILQIKP